MIASSSETQAKRDIEPLVSILIVTHERREDLAVTLKDLQRQTYPNLELIVIDDCSSTSLEETVHRYWPAATFLRNEANLGAHQSRSKGMRCAKGDFILTLDDDSSPVAADAIAQAVRHFAMEPELGLIAFYIHEGPDRPATAASSLPDRYVHDFINCGQIMRTVVARQVGDYQDFYQAYGEESEYALRVLDHGWRIRLVPALQIHHRKSPVGRHAGRTIARTWRNAMWTIVLNYPFPRVAAALTWKFAGGVWEFSRVGAWRWGIWGIASFLRGLPKAWKNRRPIRRETLRLVDLLRFRWIETADQLATAQAPSVADRIRWYGTVWRRRRRHQRGRSGVDAETGTNILHLGPRVK